MSMKRFLKILLVTIFMGAALSCTKGNKNDPTEFDLVGQWGVTTVTHIFSDGTSDFFGQQGNSYYSYWTFQINGALVIKTNPSGDMQYGDYVYNANTGNLNYIYDGYTRRVNARVLVHNPTTMTVTADLQHAGEIIYTMKKVAW